jgi:hypothetical protein
MVESMMVFIVTLFVLLFILSVFFLLCQRANIIITANETAARAAQVYGFTMANALTGDVGDSGNLNEVKYYRYFGESSLIRPAEERVEAFGVLRLRKTTFAMELQAPVASLAVVDDAMSRRHVEVTITGSYTVPFGGALEYFGLDGHQEYSHTAYADCLDLIDYMNTVDFVDDATSLKWMNNNSIKAIDSILKFLDNTGIFG